MNNVNFIFVGVCIAIYIVASVFSFTVLFLLRSIGRKTFTSSKIRALFTTLALLVLNVILSFMIILKVVPVTTGLIVIFLLAILSNLLSFWGGYSYRSQYTVISFFSIFFIIINLILFVAFIVLINTVSGFISK